MIEYICEIEEGMIPVKELIRCKDCENHRNRTNMCDIYHVHKNGNGYCDRAKAVKKNDEHV